MGDLGRSWPDQFSRPDFKVNLLHIKTLMLRGASLLSRGAHRARWCSSQLDIIPAVLGHVPVGERSNESVAQSRPFSASRVAELAPGLGASVAVMTAGYTAADYLGQGLLYLQGVEAGVSPISGIPCSILLGLALKNLLPATGEYWSALAPGIKFSSKKLLQAGIICVGAKLSAVDLATTGMIGLPAVAASVCSGLVFIPWLGKKMGLPHKMSTLIACGTSICGVTAISALAPAIKATERETSFAIANVVAFGTIGM